MHEHPILSWFFLDSECTRVAYQPPLMPSHQIRWTFQPWLVAKQDAVMSGLRRRYAGVNIGIFIKLALVVAPSSTEAKKLWDFKTRAPTHLQWRFSTLLGQLIHPLRMPFPNLWAEAALPFVDAMSSHSDQLRAQADHIKPSTQRAM